MVALLVLLLILALFGGLGFAAHFLWIVLVVALVLWVIGFFVGGVESAAGGGRRWRPHRHLCFHIRSDPLRQPR